MIRAVVFDIGNVLIEWDRRLLYRHFYPDPDQLEAFLTTVYTLEANERFDRGQPLHEFTAELASEHPGHAAAILALRERWIETLGAVIEGTVEVLAELRRRNVPLYALSNFGAGSFALIEHRYEFFEWFDGMVISGREGVVKPEPEIFARLCERYRLAPAEAVFVDDMAVNVDAARRIGMDGVVFASPGQLRRELAARGLVDRGR